MLELVTVIAAGSVCATFFSDIASRVVKGVAHLGRREAVETDPQPVQS